MANTREVMGEQACLDALVANTLTSFEDDGVTKVGASCLRYHTALTDVTLSQCRSVESYGLADCTNLEAVDMLGGGTISANAFYNDTKLAHLLLRGASKTTLSATSAFTSTHISQRNGAVYVPSNLLTTYKADTNWKNYLITTLDKYPLSDFSSITESWAELDAMTQEQIAAKYSVGDTKLIDLGTEGKVYAQIAGIGVDDLASGGKAKVTFITSETLKTSHRMNPSSDSSGTQGTGSVGGWEYSELRTYLNETVHALLPSELQSIIKSVIKYSDCIVPGETQPTYVHDQETTDKLWIPSAREVLGSNATYEQTGPIYSQLFPNTTGRIKCKPQESNEVSWWLRSTNSTGKNAFRFIGDDGKPYTLDSAGFRCIAIGFCI